MTITVLYILPVDCEMDEIVETQVLPGILENIPEHYCTVLLTTGIKHVYCIQYCTVRK